MIRIILLRHGETTWNIEGRYQGQEDTPLSEKGKLQGRQAAFALKNIPIDRAFSSPLSRSFETCRMAADYHHLTVTKDARLTEISHGLWEGIHADEIEKRYPEEFHLWHSHPEKVHMPEGESLEDVRKRVREAFDEYAARYDGETLLVAAHDAVNKAIICDLLGLSQSHFWNIKQDNACINVLECNQGIWRLVTLNNTAHMGYLVSGMEQKGL
mgnify:CR=1 FL=1